MRSLNYRSMTGDYPAEGEGKRSLPVRRRMPEAEDIEEVLEGAGAFANAPYFNLFTYPT